MPYRFKEGERMSTYVLSSLYLEALVFVGAFIWCCERIFRKKNIINFKMEISKQKEEKINYFLKIIIFAFLIWCNWGFTFPAIKDLPYVFSQKFVVIEGYTDSTDESRNNISRMRVFAVKNDNQRVIVHAATTYVTEGIWMKVNYLPNTHYGTVVERREVANE